MNQYQDREGWKYVEANELYYRGVSWHDVRDQDVEHDYVKRGVWVDLTSPTATIMALKGVRFLDSWTQARI